MDSKATTAVDHTLWQAIRRRAGDQGVTPETWFQAQRNRPDPETGADDAREAIEVEVLFDLTLRHFRELHLSDDEANAIGAAIQATLEYGEPSTVGPVGRGQRRYAFHRRNGALGIRIGAGGIRLPLRHAMRLATLLAGTREPRVLVPDDQAA